MSDPFLAGLVAGAVLGFAGIALRLFTAAALVAVGVLAWLLVQQGPEALDNVLSGLTTTEAPQPYLPVTAGVVLGAILGRSMDRVVGGRRD